MQRSSLIATVIATAGVFVAATVASVAVVNAASSSDTDHGQISLVSATVAQSSPASGVTATPSAAPTAEPTDLPALPSATATAKPKKPNTSSSADPSPTPKPTKQPKDTTSAQTPGGHADRSVSSRQASNTAVSAAGGNVIAVANVKHGAYQAWAVRIVRADGSTVTGYVDRASGTVYDWVVNQPAPSHGSSSSSGSGNGNRPHDSQDDDQGDDNDQGNHGNGANNNGNNGSGHGSDNSGHGNGHDDDDD